MDIFKSTYSSVPRTSKKHLVLLITSLLTIGFISGCKNVPPVTAGIGTGQISQQQKLNEHLQVQNTELGKKLYITDIRSRTTNGHLDVNLSLTSAYEKTLNLQYQFTWFDKDGFVIEQGKSPWKPLALHGMQTATVSGVAPTGAVTTFSIYAREVPEKHFKF